MFSPRLLGRGEINTQYSKFQCICSTCWSKVNAGYSELCFCSQRIFLLPPPCSQACSKMLNLCGNIDKYTLELQCSLCGRGCNGCSKDSSGGPSHLIIISWFNWKSQRKFAKRRNWKADPLLWSILQTPRKLDFAGSFPQLLLVHQHSFCETNSYEYLYMNWSLFAILEITDKLYTILKVLEHLKTEREKCFKMFFSCQN